MFTVKFYTDNKTIIHEADFVSVLRDEIGAEITMHRKSGDDKRLDVGYYRTICAENASQRFDKAIIENAAGKTTEIISFQ